MRALVAGAALAVVMATAPAAQARPSIVVQAVAKGATSVPPAFERFTVDWECAAINAGTAPVFLSRCSFGTVNAGSGCFECVDVPVATGRGSFRLGQPYQLCVSAYTLAPVAQTVTKCAAYDYLTNTAVVAG